MDQRRLFLFLTLCFLILIAFGPKPKPVDEQNGQLEGQQEVAAEQAPADQAEQALAALDQPEANEQSAAEDEQPQPAADMPEDVAAELEYLTLGSVDPNSPYRLLVTLTNQGAGVRRVELSSPRFRDLHDRGGYLGHLELTPAPTGGLLVQVVGAGTPAAEAGIEPGDRIVSLTAGDQEVELSSPGELLERLSKRKPRQTVTLQVARGDAAPEDHELTLRRRPLEVIRPEAENVELRTGKVPVNVESPPSFQFTFQQLGNLKIPETAEEISGVALRETNWEIAEHTDTSVTFRKRLPNYNLEIEKRYQLEPVPAEDQETSDFPGYDLTLDVVVRNLGSETLPLRYRLDGPNGLPIEGWWYSNKIGREWGAAGIRDMVARFVGGETAQIGPTDISQGDAETLQGPPLAFAGIDAQYFSAVMLPEKPNVDTTWIDEVRPISLSPPPKPRSNEPRYANVTCRLISHEQQLAAGDSLEHSYQIFTGPKRPDLLTNYHASESTQYSLKDLMYYGWFSTVSKAMLSILHFFYGIIGNYGIAIIMLTVLVRGCMFPISRKQSQSMAKMQELRPEMDKIKEKYKQDMQKQSQAMQELYRKHNINPLAGCLPMFIQLPIFLGLYRALMVDVELRQAPLISESIRWCSNLAAPDMFYDWSWFMPQFVNNGEGIFGLGPYLNVLPLVTIVLFILQQKMFMPEPANEQAAMQQQIMKFMMIFMGFLFFKVAAGLCIYFIASSIWGIVERKMLPKPDTAALATSAGTVPAKDTGTRTNGADSATRRRQNKSSKKKRR